MMNLLYHKNIYCEKSFNIIKNMVDYIQRREIKIALNQPCKPCIIL